MAPKKAAPKKARPKIATPKKNVPKKAAAKSNAGRINVFSRAFTTMTHRAAVAAAAPVLIVECNIDGDLRDDNGNIATFSSLDKANDFGAAHRRDKGPSHKCVVKTSQLG